LKSSFLLTYVLTAVFINTCNVLQISIGPVVKDDDDVEMNEAFELAKKNKQQEMLDLYALIDAEKAELLFALENAKDQLRLNFEAEKESLRDSIIKNYEKERQELENEQKLWKKQNSEYNERKRFQYETQVAEEKKHLDQWRSKLTEEQKLLSEKHEYNLIKEKELTQWRMKYEAILEEEEKQLMEKRETNNKKERELSEQMIQKEKQLNEQIKQKEKHLSEQLKELAKTEALRQELLKKKFQSVEDLKKEAQVAMSLNAKHSVIDAQSVSSFDDSFEEDYMVGLRNRKAKPTSQMAKYRMSTKGNVKRKSKANIIPTSPSSAPSETNNSPLNETNNTISPSSIRYPTNNDEGLELLWNNHPTPVLIERTTFDSVTTGLQEMVSSVVDNVPLYFITDTKKKGRKEGFEEFMKN
jgi:hypothetical protein